MKRHERSPEQKVKERKKFMGFYIQKSAKIQDEMNLSSIPVDTLRNDAERARILPIIFEQSLHRKPIIRNSR